MTNLLENEEVKKNVMTGVKISGKMISSLAVTYVQVLAITTATMVGIGLAGNACGMLQDKRKERKNNKVDNILETNELIINLDDLSIEEK